MHVNPRPVFEVHCLGLQELVRREKARDRNWFRGLYHDVNCAGVETATCRREGARHPKRSLSSLQGLKRALRRWVQEKDARSLKTLKRSSRHAEEHLEKQLVVRGAESLAMLTCLPYA